MIPDALEPIAHELGVNTRGQIASTDVTDEPVGEVYKIGELGDAIEQAKEFEGKGVAKKPGKPRIGGAQSKSEEEGIKQEVGESATTAMDAAAAGDLKDVSKALGEIVDETGSDTLPMGPKLQKAAEHLRGQEVESAGAIDKLDTAARGIEDERIQDAEFDVQKAEDTIEAEARLKRISDEIQKKAAEKGVDSRKAMEAAEEKALTGQDVTATEVVKDTGEGANKEFAEKSVEDLLELRKTGDEKTRGKIDALLGKLGSDKQRRKAA
jgi:hypothetical protein